jgi:hypothetical protein
VGATAVNKRLIRDDNGSKILNSGFVSLLLAEGKQQIWGNSTEFLVGWIVVSGESRSSWPLWVKVAVKSD